MFTQQKAGSVAEGVQRSFEEPCTQTLMHPATELKGYICCVCVCEGKERLTLGYVDEQQVCVRVCVYHLGLCV